MSLGNNEEDLILERNAAFRVLYQWEIEESAKIEEAVVVSSDSAPWKSDGGLREFYERYLSEYPSKEIVESLSWKSLDEVSDLMDKVGASLLTLDGVVSSLESERDLMLSELADLDLKSRDLLREQSELERVVHDLESRMSVASTMKEVSMITRESLVLNFSKFANVVTSVEKSLQFLSRYSNKESILLNRQFDHLRFQLCAMAISVGSEAISTYSTRMCNFTNSVKTLSTLMLYTKFIETLQVVTNISELFRGQTDGSYLRALSELEKNFFAEREKIVSPVLAAFISGQLASGRLSHAIRKVASFVGSLTLQEIALSEKVFGLVGVGGSASLIRSLGTVMYTQLRSAVITSEDLPELGESSEVVRLEISTEHEILRPVAHKLHSDIQERLIFKIASQNGNDRPVEFCLESLSLISGVLDNETFFEIANEIVNNCLDKLLFLQKTGANNSTTLEPLLRLISELLIIRERITAIECEFGTHNGQLFEKHGMRDQFRKLVGQSNSDNAVRATERIERELAHLCAQFNAVVIAEALTALHVEHDLDTYISSLRSKMKSLLAPGLDVVLIKPIVEALRAMDTEPGTSEIADALQQDVSKS